MSFFRTPIDEEVQKALFRRIEAVSNKEYSSLGTLEPRTGEKGDPFENEFAKKLLSGEFQEGDSVVVTSKKNNLVINKTTSK